MNPKNLLNSLQTTKKTYFCNIISLNTLFYTLIIFVLQLYLLIIQIRYFIRYTSLPSPSDTPVFSSTSFQDTPLFLISLAIACLCILTNLFIGSIRIGNYGNDCVKLGKDFNMHLTNNLLKLIFNKQNENHLQTPNINLKIKKLFLFNKYWKFFLPISQLLHMISSLCLLYCDLITEKNLIQSKYLPIGDAFTTKLDFLYGEPTQRITKLFDSTNGNNSLIKSIDDFTTKENLNNDHGYNKISIDLNYLNFFLSFTLLLIKLLRLFWHTNRLFSILLFLHTFIATTLCLLSYTAFELLSKFQLISELNSYISLLIFKEKQFAFIFTYIISLIIYLTSCCFFMLFAFKKYKLVLNKFEFNLIKYFQLNFQLALVNATDKTVQNKHFGANNAISEVVNISPAASIVATSSSSSSHGSSSASSASSTSSPATESADLTTTTTILKAKSDSDSERSTNESLKQSSGNVEISMYKEQLVLSMLFLIYCAIRSLFIYDTLVVYKYTNDIILLNSIFIEFIAIITWILFILIITMKSSWQFKLDKVYKLINWNWLYEYQVKLKHMSDEARKVVNTHQQQTLINNSNKMINGLYVRDDSVLNKSIQSNSAGSDISYMPVILSNSNNLSGIVASSASTQGSTKSASKSSYQSLSNTNMDILRTSNATNTILDVTKLYQPQRMFNNNQDNFEALYSKPKRTVTLNVAADEYTSPLLVNNNNNNNGSNIHDYQQKPSLIDQYDRIVNSKRINFNDAHLSLHQHSYLNNQLNVENELNSSVNYRPRLYQRSYSQRLPKAISFDSNLVQELNLRRNMIFNKIPEQQLTMQAKHNNNNSNSTSSSRILNDENLVIKTDNCSQNKGILSKSGSKLCTPNVNSILKGNGSNKSTLALNEQSSSPTDSGRDSLNESPINSKQQSLDISTVTTNTKPITNYNNHLIDTKC